MRPPNQIARDRLVSVLSRMPRASAPDLAAALHISVRSLHRLLAELPAGQLLSAGNSRRTRYALRRPSRHDRNHRRDRDSNLNHHRSRGAIPLYAIDATGQATQISNLALVHPQGSLLPLADTGWPAPPESRDGWWDGLPYPIYDSRPQGFIGRQLARARHQGLGLSPNPDEWDDDDIVCFLCHAGTDVSGNLLLGDEACESWLRAKLAPPEPVGSANLGAHYFTRAQEALMGGVAGSSAAGEFPKFTALREPGHATPHVLVKFSGAGDSAAERRWADLLVCEHLALDCAGTLPGVSGARTRVLGHGGRVFLEAERFDRFGLHGRAPLCTLEVLAHAFLGEGSSDWPLLVKRLQQTGLVDAGTSGAVERLWWFGRLIANTDMHLGNLSFHLAPSAAPSQPAACLRIAPAYDMLPMAYAPLPGGEVPPREFTPPLPLPAQREAWQIACKAALAFWHHAGTDERISAPFRSLCAGNYRKLQEMAAQF